MRLGVICTEGQFPDRTHSRFHPNAAFDSDFEKKQLINWHARSPTDWQPHPMFGPMNGKLLQIHIDYHLRQFAA